MVAGDIMAEAPHQHMQQGEDHLSAFFPSAWGLEQQHSYFRDSGSMGSTLTHMAIRIVSETPPTKMKLSQ